MLVAVSLLALFPGALPLAAAPRGAETRASLTGTIVSSATERALPGATVEAFEWLDTSALRERRAAGLFVPEPLVAGAIDAAGRFDLRVPAGRRVYVSARAPGHSATRFAFLAAPVAGEPPRDFGRAGLSSGRRLTGRVTGPDGKPLANARVAALTAPARPGAASNPAGTPPGVALFTSAARSAPDGSFTLDGLPERAVTLRVDAEEFAPVILPEPGGSGRVSVRLSPGHDVSGLVVLPDGSPAGGAWVLAGRDGLEGLTRADAHGRFRLARLAPGVRVLTATADDIVVPAGNTDAAADRRSWAPSTALRLVIPPPAGAAALRLTLRPGSTVQARVVKLPARDPLAGAWLTLTEPGSEASRTAFTADRGEAIFPGVPAGRIVLHASADGFLDEVNGPRQVVAGASTPITAALTAASSIEGTVRDNAGSPVAGARVEVLALALEPGPVPIPRHIPMAEAALSDAQGRFRLRRIRVAPAMLLEVEREGFVPWKRSDLRLRAGEGLTGVDAVLDAGLLITGRVVDPARRPVAGAAVTASRAREDAPMGGAPNRPRGPRGPRTVGGAEALPGAATARIPALTSAQSAQGVLTDPSGTPVYWRPRWADPTFPVVAGVPAYVQNLPSGRYRLRVLLPGGRVDEQSVTIAPGGTTRVWVE